MVYYSHRLKVEEKKNRRKAVKFIFLTIISIFIIFKFGLPLVIRFVSFIYDLRQSSENIEITDNTPPPPPNIESTPLVTNDKDIEIKGNTEGGAKVIITFNGEKSEALSDKDGYFSKSFTLDKGDNYFYLEAVDTAGNTSQKTQNYKVTYDTEPPELTIESPSNNSEYYGSKQRQVNIEGSTEENANVQINGRWVIVNSSGDFTFTVMLSDGNNEFAISAEDAAGNKTETSLTLIYTQ